MISIFSAHISLHEFSSVQSPELFFSERRLYSQVVLIIVHVAPHSNWLVFSQQCQEACMIHFQSATIVFRCDW